jgi:hypothetical protein
MAQRGRGRGGAGGAGAAGARRGVRAVRPRRVRLAAARLDARLVQPRVRRDTPRRTRPRGDGRDRRASCAARRGAARCRPSQPLPPGVDLWAQVLFEAGASLFCPAVMVAADYEHCAIVVAIRGTLSLDGAPPLRPLPLPRTNWTRLVPRPVLTGHASSLPRGRLADRRHRALLRVPRRRGGRRARAARRGGRCDGPAAERRRRRRAVGRARRRMGPPYCCPYPCPYCTLTPLLPTVAPTHVPTAHSLC